MTAWTSRIRKRALDSTKTPRVCDCSPAMLLLQGTVCFNQCALKLSNTSICLFYRVQSVGVREGVLFLVCTRHW